MLVQSIAYIEAPVPARCAGEAISTWVPERKSSAWRRGGFGNLILI